MSKALFSVWCVDTANNPGLTVGNMYRVFKDDGPFYYIKNDTGMYGYYYKQRFTDVPPSAAVVEEVPFKFEGAYELIPTDRNATHNITPSPVTPSKGIPDLDALLDAEASVIAKNIAGLHFRLMEQPDATPAAAARPCRRRAATAHSRDAHPAAARPRRARRQPSLPRRAPCISAARWAGHPRPEGKL